MTTDDQAKPDDQARATMADMVVHYDLVQMKEEVKTDFTADSSTHRLLRQADISKRFQRRRASRQAKNNGDA